MQALSNSVSEIFSAPMLGDMEWHDRLNQALKVKNWSVPDLAREIGEPEDKAVFDRLYKYTSGEVKSPRGNWLARIAAAIGMTEAELRFGTRPASAPLVIRPEGPEASEVSPAPNAPKFSEFGDFDVEVRGITVGGDDDEFYFNGKISELVRRPPGLRHKKGVFAVMVSNDSMVPRYDPGETIYVQERSPVAGDHVVIELYHPTNPEQAGKSFVKKFERRTGRRIYCTQYNPPKEVEFDAGEVKTVFRVFPNSELFG
jgi:phage repressor protein C with HTH and peptisase S24 domain